MSVLALLIMASLAMGITFLIGFIWAVRSGQYEDTCTPSMRLLLEERRSAAMKNQSAAEAAGAPAPAAESETGKE